MKAGYIARKGDFYFALLVVHLANALLLTHNSNIAVDSHSVLLYQRNTRKLRLFKTIPFGHCQVHFVKASLEELLGEFAGDLLSFGQKHYTARHAVQTMDEVEFREFVLLSQNGF